jgi:hypothetical protein
MSVEALAFTYGRVGKPQYWQWILIIIKEWEWRVASRSAMWLRPDLPPCEPAMETAVS